MIEFDLEGAMPAHRPWTSAHRAGNSIGHAVDAVRAGADLLETDIWLHRGRLEVRHTKTMGPIPLLWDRWMLAPGWKPRLELDTLLRITPPQTLLFLDFKGKNRGLGPAVIAERDRVAPSRVLAICGRDYAVLDRIADAPGVLLFYSVGKENEWEAGLARVANSPFPAMSLLADLATEERMAVLRSINATVVCWGVNDPVQAWALAERGVAGFTTDSTDLMADVMARRAEADGVDDSAPM